MDIMEFVLVAAYLFVVAGVAVVVRYYDIPVSIKDWASIVKTFIGAIFAIGLGAWLMIDPANVDALIDPKVFVELIALGVAGMASFRAFVGQVAPDVKI